MKFWALICCLLVSSAAQAESRVIVGEEWLVGDWLVRAEAEKDGTFFYCIAGYVYADETALALARYKDGGLAFFGLNQNWQLPQSGEFDGEVRLEAKVRPVKYFFFGNYFWTEAIFEEERLWDELLTTKTLVFSSAEIQVQFQLGDLDIHPVLAALRDCALTEGQAMLPP